jgi:6-phosphofructokinase 1
MDDEYCNADSHVANLQFHELVDDDVVLVDIVRKKGMSSVSRAFPRAGPRKNLHFHPSKVNAAILSAGGLCCGINNVIRELVHSLYYLYGANKVYGIQGGFRGFHDPKCPPILLTIDLVENIHHEGGTMLGSSRGGFDIEKIFDFVTKYDINQLYIIGGDGTHRGAYAIHQAGMDRGLELAVAGIPKTIDK